MEIISKFDINMQLEQINSNIENHTSRKMTDRSVVTDASINEDQPMIDSNNRFDDLDRLKILAYGVGHFINDLVAACWFNYLLYFLKRVVQTDAAVAALLSGQFCDGVATPIVGYVSDKYRTKWGQRTPWYIFGLIFVFICYIPIYQGYKSDNVSNEYAYYILFPGLFNVGWAALQISHMSLVPSLTCSRKRRDKLNNLRNSFTFIANFVVLGMGLIIFKIMNSPFWQYRIISYVVAGLGLSTSLFFLWHIKEVPLSKACLEKAQALKQQIAEQKQIDKQKLMSDTQFSQDQDDVHVHASKRMVKAESIKDWFKMPKFYLFGVCYMGVRLYTNMFGTFLPFYLEGVISLGFDNTKQITDSVPFSVALVPLIIYSSSVIVSSKLNKFYQLFGRKKALFVGTLICIICLGSMFFLTKEVGWIMYILAIFIGCSQTMVLSTGINFISDVVGTKAKTGAFVFGIYSLLDKFSAGLAIYFVGSNQAYIKDPSKLNDDQRSFIKYTIILLPALSCILASVIVLSYPVQEYSKKKKIGQIKKSALEQQLVI